MGDRTDHSRSMKLLALLLLGSLTLNFIGAKTYIVQTEDDEDNDGVARLVRSGWKPGKDVQIGSKWKGKGQDFAALKEPEVKGTGKGNDNKWEDGTKWQSGNNWNSTNKWKGKGGTTWTDDRNRRSWKNDDRK